MLLSEPWGACRALHSVFLSPRHNLARPVYCPPHDPLHARADRLLDRPFRVVWRADVHLDYLADHLSHHRRGRSDVADGAVGESGKIAWVAAGGKYCGKHSAAFFHDPARLR